jgi:hypothetical protein
METGKSKPENGNSKIETRNPKSETRKAKLDIRMGPASTNDRCHPEWSWACGPAMEMKVIAFVTPAQVGVHVPTSPIPAFAGMT